MKPCANLVQPECLCKLVQTQTRPGFCANLCKFSHTGYTPVFKTALAEASSALPRLTALVRWMASLNSPNRSLFMSVFRNQRPTIPSRPAIPERAG